MPSTPGNVIWFGPDGGPFIVASSVNPLPVVANAGTGTFAVGGVTGDGAALSGNPVRVGGSDGTNIRTLATDTSGKLNANAVAQFQANASLPALTTGQGAVLQSDPSGTLKTGIAPLGTPVYGTASSGGAAAANVSLASASGKMLFLDGFDIDGLGATAGAAVTVAITGLLGGTLTYLVGIPAGVTVPFHQSFRFNPPLQARS